jgi:hypothetical protein
MATLLQGPPLRRVPSTLTWLQAHHADAYVQMADSYKRKTRDYGKTAGQTERLIKSLSMTMGLRPPLGHSTLCPSLDT